MFWTIHGKYKTPVLSNIFLIRKGLEKDHNIWQDLEIIYNCLRILQYLTLQEPKVFPYNIWKDLIWGTCWSQWWCGKSETPFFLKNLKRKSWVEDHAGGGRDLKFKSQVVWSKKGFGTTHPRQILGGTSHLLLLDYHLPFHQHKPCPRVIMSMAWYDLYSWLNRNLCFGCLEKILAWSLRNIWIWARSSYFLLCSIHVHLLVEGGQSRLNQEKTKSPILQLTQVSLIIYNCKKIWLSGC